MAAHFPGVAQALIYKRDWLKRDLWAQNSLLSEMMRSCKYVYIHVFVSWISDAFCVQNN